jgi:hypothetical protein
LQARKGDILGDYQQGTGESADKLYMIATTISDEAKSWMRDISRQNTTSNCSACVTWAATAKSCSGEARMVYL